RRSAFSALPIWPPILTGPPNSRCPLHSWRSRASLFDRLAFASPLYRQETAHIRLADFRSIRGTCGWAGKNGCTMNGEPGDRRWSAPGKLNLVPNVHGDRGAPHAHAAEPCPSANPDGRRRKLLALTRYSRLAASTRQRLLLFVPELESAGFDVTVAPFFADDHMRRLASGHRAGPGAVLRAIAGRLSSLSDVASHDLLWLQYEAFPFLPAWFERLLLARKVPFVVDYDDAIFHTYDLNANPLVRRFLGRKLEPLARAAAAITVGNAYLETWARRHNSEVHLFPTVVDTNQYVGAERRSGGPPTVGWIGSPSTWPYVAGILPAIAPVLDRHGARFLAVGAGPAAEGLKRVEARPWREEREAQDIAEMDIGIMPVPDTAWGRGKCGYKLIQYMASGRPAIASPVGVNSQIIVEGETGFLAADSSQWSARLELLLSNPALCRRLGAAGQSRAAQHYSRAAVAPAFVSLLSRLARSPRR
ncbi:MAG: glycosyltransferase family 4 protein, partial [Sphingomonadaceae bacterium]